MGVRRGIDRKKVGCRSLIDAYLEGQVGVNKFKLYFPIFRVKFVNLFNIRVTVPVNTISNSMNYLFTVITLCF